MASLDNSFKYNPSIGMCKDEAVFKGQTYRISVLTERLVRLEYSPTGNFVDNLTALVKNRVFSMPQFNTQEDDNILVIKTRYFELIYSKERPFKGSAVAPFSNLRIKLNGTDKEWYYGQAEARRYKAVPKDLDKYPFVEWENGLYSVDGYVSLNDSENFVIEPTGYVKKRNSDSMDIYVFMYKRDYGLCLGDYFALTGHPTLIPRYALGIWWSRDKIYTFEHIKNLLSSFNKHQIPVAMFLLNEFWHIKDKEDYNLHKTGFTFNPDWFPNPRELSDYLLQRGVHLGVNIDPSEGVRKEERSYPLVAQSMGVTDQSVIPFNIYNEFFATSYVNFLIKPIIYEGVDCFWIDYKGEKEDLAALDYYHEGAFKASNKRGILMTRNPLIAAHNYGILYSGETEVSWKLLKALPEVNYSAANLGISWWSHDVGGYKNGIEESELYLRHVQFATFSPIFRFSSLRGLYYKREPWLWDNYTYMIVKDYCTLRHRLIPYLYTENYAYSVNGLPLIQPVYYFAPGNYYDDAELKSEYFFGSQLLVAPIVKTKNVIMNRSDERVFLPDGMWYDFKSGKKFPGNNIYVMFYKDEDYPVFAKAGAIIPLANIETNINNTNNPQSLEFQIFPGKDNIYTLYEDDGVSKLYKEGYYIKTELRYKFEKDNYSFSIKPFEGKTEIIPKYRTYFIKFRNTRLPGTVNVTVGGMDLDAIKYKKYVVDNDFVVELRNIDTTKEVMVNIRGTDIDIEAVHLINEDINSIISDLKIKTVLKENIFDILFSEMEIKDKRIAIRKLKTKGLSSQHIKMFMKLLEYISEI